MGMARAARRVATPVDENDARRTRRATRTRARGAGERSDDYGVGERERPMSTDHATLASGALPLAKMKKCDAERLLVLHILPHVQRL